MISRKVEIRRYPASLSGQGTILFVHGGYVDSSCWGFNFIPFFQQNGYDCFTVDLSGHGASDGREQIHQFGIDHYAEDVAAAIREIGEPAILVGHSMGARVLERYLERGEARAAIFLAPVPTTGTTGSALQLSLRFPAFFTVLDDAVNGRITPEVAEWMTKVYFAPGTSPEETMKYLPMVGPESDQAVAEMALPQMKWSARRRSLPVLVAGGSDDAVFPASMLHFLASAWDADVYRVEGAGHMLMLDPQWRELAGHMLDWLVRQDMDEAA